MAPGPNWAKQRETQEALSAFAIYVISRLKNHALEPLYSALKAPVRHKVPNHGLHCLKASLRRKEMALRQ